MNKIYKKYENFSNPNTNIWSNLWKFNIILSMVKTWFKDAAIAWIIYHCKAHAISIALRGPKQPKYRKLKIEYRAQQSLESMPIDTFGLHNFSKQSLFVMS